MEKITREQLLEMERKPKTKKDHILEKIYIFLPIVMGLLHLIEYYYMPNFQVNSNTHVYGIFLGILLLMYITALLIGYFKKDIYQKLLYKAPFYAFVFALLMGYDILTLKTGKLMLPYFPWVDQILNAAITDRIYLLDCVKNSLILLFTGYFIGALLGIITGILCGYNKRVNYWVSPFMRLLGPIPSTTWLPLVMVLVTTLFKGAVFIIALGVWFSVTLATITGIYNVNKEYYDAAKTLGAKGSQLITHIALPSALPSIFQGLTQGMSSACTALLIAEMLGVKSGLGWYINWQKAWAEFAKLYAAIIIICITFILVNWILNKIKRTVLKWQEDI